MSIRVDRDQARLHVTKATLAAPGPLAGAAQGMLWVRTSSCQMRGHGALETWPLRGRAEF